MYQSIILPKCMRESKMLLKKKTKKLAVENIFLIKWPKEECSNPLRQRALRFVNVLDSEHFVQWKGEKKKENFQFITILYIIKGKS